MVFLRTKKQVVYFVDPPRMALLFSDSLFSRPDSAVLKKQNRTEEDDIAPTNKIDKADDILNISVNVGAFKQEELEVKIVGNFIEIEAHRLLTGTAGAAERHFIQKFKVPRAMDRASMQISFDGKGNLVIAARAKRFEPPPLKRGRTKPTLVTK